MSGKTRRRRQEKPANAVAPGAPPSRATQAGVDRYIAGQLKVIYDEVVAEAIPDRILLLLDRLDDESKS